ncbi:HAMP domain-containing histidine kinase [Candidatus Sulfurimonas marisnigri]|uniref:histidine kinase n=1 Tax=Candidatus Sulfurimonas marisnigri TaxID=2740405 RepID=A0A7S7RPU7_9BACT|nr:HAMP domain-containing sensor histidine kinase [Candidatus Sulfurimonas marisnigri]QOY54762.1 HAMP domain-containing histidine kinase [Candidatus Sulfurimonas marisnigri]
MNNITKKSFYSFLTLYLLSSFIFLLFASYWFYTSQKTIEMQNNYYKMNHISDRVSSSIIKAHMMDNKFVLDSFENATVALYDNKYKLIDGQNIQKVDLSKEYYMEGDTFTLVSKRTAGHLGIDYVAVQSNEFTQSVTKLRNKVIITSIFVGIIIIIISVILSYIFLRPIKDKMQEIEEFVKDTTHELNTPITALMMSTSRAKNKKIYDEKIIQNISISTKQLYDIYSSLSFLSFDAKSEEAVELNFASVVNESIKYFNELLEKKNIIVEFKKTTCTLTIAPTKAKMLINNLLSNAIKYSPPNKKIYISVLENSFAIQDEGIGIAKDKLDTIFKRFTRANSYAGGFGVGLNIVDSIVKEYNFGIDVTSTENVGTTVNVRFH